MDMLRLWLKYSLCYKFWHFSFQALFVKYFDGTNYSSLKIINFHRLNHKLKYLLKQAKYLQSEYVLQIKCFDVNLNFLLKF